jgi:hypothetical protein
MSQSFRAVITLLDPIEGHPDQGLPDIESPVDPDYGVGAERPSHPIVIRPPGGPVTIWPPSVDNSLPPLPPGFWGGVAPPSVDNTLPVPPVAGNLPVFPGTPEHPIAAPPGTIWPPLPVHLPSPPSGSPDNLLVIVWVPGVGYRYVVVDPSLHPDQGLPPHPQPK